MKSDPISWRWKPQKCISHIWASVRVLPLADWSSSWGSGKRSFIHFGFFGKIINTGWLKLFFILFRKKEERQIKSFFKGPGTQGQRKVSEPTEGLAQLFCNWSETTQMGCMWDDKMLGKVKWPLRRGASIGK